MRTTPHATGGSPFFNFFIQDIDVALSIFGERDASALLLVGLNSDGSAARVAGFPSRNQLSISNTSSRDAVSHADEPSFSYGTTIAACATRLCG
jgi:hypothetical protein